MLNKSEIAILTIAVSIGSQNYFKMKQCRHFMQITYSPNNVLITMSCRLRGGCERLLGIAVYNNLSEGNWNLIDANNITRATLEGFGSNFSVDNIVFEPSDSHLPLIDISSLGYSDFV